MNDLKIFNKEIIPVYETTTGEKVVVGRELHERLGIGKDYSTWFKDMCSYGFEEGESYSPFLGNRSDGRPGRGRTEHLMKFDMAKHIAMIQRSETGKAIRQKLIDLEKDVSKAADDFEELSDETKSLYKTVMALVEVERKQNELKKQVSKISQRVDNISDIIILNPTNWRTESNKIINMIAYAKGGNKYAGAVRSEIYSALDKRLGKRLGDRLNRRKERMRKEGVAKTTIDKLNILDIIESSNDRKSLIDGYLHVVKETAIRYGVDKVMLDEKMP